ncbi:hypothetical protein [uncultured Roseivirga sp.]|uniref:hypothetical protein n=1 Tax=uncultured Roseivirga sp. TaxID=543088 RepID=UPI0030DCFAC5|tara:strand:- start:13252 stop:13824 length:573 start_codon:yes stop_codon:yes gene_type:complete
MKNSNSFSTKMASKSSDELNSIISSGSAYLEEAKTAARWELEKREKDGRLAKEIEHKKNPYKGEERYDEFKKSISVTSSFRFRPIFTETFTSSSDNDLIQQTAMAVFKRLEWALVYIDSKHLEARRANDANKPWTEKIMVSITNTGQVRVESTSLKDTFFDRGLNSKCVKLFIHVYKEIETELKKAKLNN